MPENSETIRCPGCDLELPEDDVRAQKAHLESRHPEIIAERLESAGFRQEGGEWVDTLSSDEYV